MSLSYSCNENTGAVTVWYGSVPYADLTDTSTNFEQKLERAQEIVSAVNRLRRIERAGEMARSER